MTETSVSHALALMANRIADPRILSAKLVRRRKQKEKCLHCTGMTFRTAFERGREHLEGLEKGNSENALYKHKSDHQEALQGNL